MTTVACGAGSGAPEEPTTAEPTPSPVVHPPVAIAYAPDYTSARASLAYGCNLIGGLAGLVRGKRVTVKVNLAGWGESLFSLPAVETYIVHHETAIALATVLLDAGAARVTFVESSLAPDGLDAFASRLGWDVDALLRLGPVELINTRNATGLPYATLAVPGGRVFHSLTVHQAYAETDVFVTLSKMKNHRVAGVSLGLKNLFGMPPNSLYGNDAPSEDARDVRMLIHDRRGSEREMLPGEIPELADRGPDVRVPHATVDMCAARPIHLSVVEGITTIAGGEGPWNLPCDDIRLVEPHLLVVGFDPVATDSVATAVMGYPDPMASAAPFLNAENHIRLAADRGLGIGDLKRIDVRGLSIDKVRTPFAWL